MHAPDRTPTLFEDAIEIPAWLEADRSTPYAERLHRDREIGAQLGGAKPLARVRAWRRRQTEERAPDEQALAARLDRARRLISMLMMAIGALAGVGVASAVFHYDGTWPVNVVTVLAVFVVLQVVLIASTLILMSPRLSRTRVVQDLMGALNPGAVVAALYRRLTHLEGGAANMLVWREARGPAAARFARWQMLAWSQWAAVAFNLAALVTAASLIAFTDLAFGWSTTLRVESATALRITDALATPWRWLWPDAAPTSSLVEDSRFFRLSSAPSGHASAESLTGWWPFLLAAIVTYGLAPRLVLLGVALQRVRAAIAHLLLDDPHVTALLDRMNAPEIELAAEDPESPRIALASRALAPPRGSSGETVAIVWGGALPADAASAWSAQHLQRRIEQTFEAGGGRDLNSDREVIAAVQTAQPAAVIVFVRSWEAPLLDLQDFLTELRAALGRERSIVVTPVGAQTTSATESQREIWSRWVARIADPALYLESGA